MAKAVRHRRIVEQALGQLVATSPLRVLARRKISNRAYFLLRAEGIGRRQAWSMMRKLRAAARRLRTSGSTPESDEAAMAVDLILVP